MPSFSLTLHHFTARLLWTTIAATIAIGLCAGAASAAATASLSGSALAGAAAECADADLEASDAATAERLSKAAACLVNKERTRRGIRKLRYNDQLERSSLWQNDDMIRFGYFAHDRAGGPSFQRRITRFGYGKGSRGVSLGENIAWSTAYGGTAREIVALWMDSPGHRANILRRKFKEQGMSVVYATDGTGDYQDAGPYVVFTNQFGTRY